MDATRTPQTIELKPGEKVQVWPPLRGSSRELAERASRAAAERDAEFLRRLDRLIEQGDRTLELLQRVLLNGGGR